jgi:hypothetical protein
MTISYYRGQQWMRKDGAVPMNVTGGGRVSWANVLPNITMATHVISSGYLKVKPRCHVSVGHQTELVPEHMDLTPTTPDGKPDRTFFFLGQAVARYYAARKSAMSGMHMVGRNNYVVASECFASQGGERYRGKYPTCGSPTAAYLPSPNVGCCVEEPVEYKDYLHMLSNANFSLNIKGGDSGSSRTFDAILAGTPQFIVSDGFMWFYAPFPCTVPWWKFTKVMKQSSFMRNTVATMTEALDQAMPQRTAMKEMQDSYKDDLLWVSRRSLSANNLLMQAAKQCLPRRFDSKSQGAKKSLGRVKNHKCVNQVLKI